MIKYCVLLQVFVSSSLLAHCANLEVQPISAKTSRCKLNCQSFVEGDVIIFHVQTPVEPFVGRGVELNELSGQKMVVVTGAKGVGKTELVKKYAQIFKQGDKTSNIIWIDAGSYESLVLSFKQLGSRIGVDIQKKTPTKILQETFEYFKNKPTLFIFDNAPSDNFVLNNLSEFIPQRNNNFHFVVTSRDKNWNRNIFKIINLNVFTKEESKEYINKRLHGLNVEDSEDIDRLAVILKNLPVALSRATDFILQQNMSKQYTINDFICQFEELDAIKQPTVSEDQPTIQDDQLEDYLTKTRTHEQPSTTRRPQYINKKYHTRHNYGWGLSDVGQKISSAAHGVKQEVKGLFSQIHSDISNLFT